ncbi:MAG: hypothetical protein ACXVEE_32330 [Polyangiales bacterium]
MRGAVFCLTGLLGMGALSCSSGGGGDLQWLTENPKTFGTPIANVSNPKTRVKDGSDVHALGVVVVAVDTYDETADGKSAGDIFVMDPVQNGPKGTPWSGVRLYRPTKNPPDLELAAGQGVDLFGTYTAFTGPPSSPFDSGIVVPEISNGALTLTFEGKAPEPVDLTYDDIKDPTAAIPYTGRLVRFKNVQLFSDFATKRFEASIFTADKTVTMTAKFFPIQNDPTIKNGVTLKSVTGVLDYFYGLKLCPRSPADVEH